MTTDAIGPGFAEELKKLRAKVPIMETTIQNLASSVADMIILREAILEQVRLDNPRIYEKIEALFVCQRCHASSNRCDCTGGPWNGEPECICTEMPPMPGCKAHTKNYT